MDAEFVRLCNRQAMRRLLAEALEVHPTGIASAQAPTLPQFPIFFARQAQSAARIHWRHRLCLLVLIEASLTHLRCLHFSTAHLVLALPVLSLTSLATVAG